MQVRIESTEWYPVYSVTEAEHQGVSREVDEETLARWAAAEAAFWKAQKEMQDVVDPPCPECGCRTSRHQEWSAQWDRWACLTCKKCQYGAPAERLTSL